MDTLIHADIFFFVTTIAVVIITLLFIVLLIYLIQAIRRVRDIAEQVRDETILFREDVHQLRDQVKRTGFQAKSFLTVFQNVFTRKKSKK
jgi:uncharacterized protein YoxC